MPEKTETVPEDVNDNHPAFYADIQDIVEDVFKTADMEVHPFLVRIYTKLDSMCYLSLGRLDVYEFTGLVVHR